MPAGRHNFVIQKGETWTRVITPQINGAAVAGLEDYAGRMTIRAKVTDASALLELTEANSRVTMGALTVTLSLTAATTAAIPCVGKEARYEYDLEIESPSGVVTPILAGDVIVRQMVTR